MPTDPHPSPALLERFMRNDTEPADNRKVVRHLLTGCQDCLKATRRLWRLGDEEAEAVRKWLVRPRRAGDGEVFARLAQRAGSRAAEIDAQRHALPQLLAELDALSPAERTARILTGAVPASAPLAEAWIERVERRLEARGSSAVAEAELGTLLTAKLDPGLWGTAVIDPLRSRAWAAFGEARRMAQDLEGADRALATAEALIAAGETDASIEAEILYLKARLRIDQHRLEEAGRLVERSVALLRRCGDRGSLSRALILEGAVHNWTGQDAEALERLHESLRLLEGQPKDRSRLRAEALYRLVPLVEDTDEALRIVGESRALYEELGDRPNLARLRRLEGKVEELRGDYAAAEEALNEARQELLAEGLGRESAQASLDLALLYARQGRAVDTHQIARWTFPVLSSTGVQRETLFALLVLQWEAESERINPELIGEIARYLDPAPRSGRAGFSAVH